MANNNKKTGSSNLSLYTQTNLKPSSKLIIRRTTCNSRIIPRTTLRPSSKPQHSNDDNKHVVILKSMKRINFAEWIRIQCETTSIVHNPPTDYRGTRTGCEHREQEREFCSAWRMSRRARLSTMQPFVHVRKRYSGHIVWSILVEIGLWIRSGTGRRPALGFMSYSLRSDTTTRRHAANAHGESSKRASIPRPASAATCRVYRAASPCLLATYASDTLMTGGPPTRIRLVPEDVGLAEGHSVTGSSVVTNGFEWWIFGLIGKMLLRVQRGT